MKKILLFLLLSLAVLCFIGCDDDDESGENITVTLPDANTAWVEGQVGTQVKWAGASGSQVTIEIWRAGRYVANYKVGCINNGSLINSSPVELPEDASTASNYKIKVYDKVGNYGLSKEFNIEKSEKSIKITEPTTATTWVHGDTDVKIKWEQATVSDDSVYIRLYKKDAFLLNIASTSVPNNGSYTIPFAIPSNWSASKEYKIRIFGASVNSNEYGISSFFAIEKKQAAINLTFPKTTTVFNRSKEKLRLEWTGVTGDSLTVYLFDGSFSYGKIAKLVATASGSIEIDIEESWGISNKFKVKVVDTDGNFGISNYFMIGNIDSNAANLIAYFPFNGNTNDASGHNVVFDVKGHVGLDVDDRFGDSDKAMKINADNDTSYVILDDIARVLKNDSFAGNLSFSFWYKADVAKAGNQQTLFSAVDTAGKNVLKLILTADGAFRLDHDNLYSSTMRKGSMNMKYTDGELYYVCLILNSNSMMDLAVFSKKTDGSIFRKEYHFDNINFTWSNVDSFSMFAGKNTAGNYVDKYFGIMDDVRIYKKVISEKNIETYFHESNFAE